MPVSLSHMRKTFDRTGAQEKLERIKLDRAEIALESARLSLQEKYRKVDAPEQGATKKNDSRAAILLRFLFGSLVLFFSR